MAATEKTFVVTITVDDKEMTEEPRKHWRTREQGCSQSLDESWMTKHLQGTNLWIAKHNVDVKFELIHDRRID